MADENQSSKMSRRKFIKNSSYAAGGVIGGGLVGTLIGTNIPGVTNEDTQTKTKSESASRNHFNRAYMYFTRNSDFDTLTAATERIFPEDKNGPGAKKLDVPYFIDHQLAGDYGHNAKEYMQGPFHTGTDTQGYQSPLRRHEIFMIGIRALESESQSDYDDSFADLDNDKQDKILKKFEDDKVKIKGVLASDFFELLRTATLSGAYADPVYGGNNDMEGWGMKNFPGAQMSYLNKIEKEKFVDNEIKPQSLSSMS